MRTTQSGDQDRKRSLFREWEYLVERYDPIYPLDVKRRILEIQDEIDVLEMQKEEEKENESQTQI